MENQNALSNLIQQLSLSSQNLQNMGPPNVQHGAPPGFPPSQFPNYPPGHMNGAVNPNLYPPFPQVQFHQQPPMQFLPSQQPPVNFPSNPPPSFSMPHQRTAQGLIPPMSPSPIPATTESPPPSILSDLLGLQSEPSPPIQIQAPTPVTPVLPLSVSPSPTLPRADLRASSENLKSPGGRKKEEQPGIFLPPGSQIIHNVDPEALKKKTQALEVTPITLYSSLDYTYQPGTTIAVNKTYIGYIVRGDMIRVLNQKSASRGLLKGHTGIITDLSFFRGDVDLLLSCCKDGNIFIWKLSEQADGNISHELVFQIKGDKQVSVIRAVWHPFDETQFATAESDNSVKLWNRSACSSNTIDRNSAQSISVVLPENENVQDLSFSPDGGELAVATVNTVKFFQVGVSTAPVLAQFQPHDQQISGIAYVRANAEQTLFITGALRNSDIKLWSVDTKTNKFVCLQNVCLVCSAAGESYFWNHFSLDDTGAFLFIANTKEKTIHVLHLKTATDESRFDYITEFVVDQPILSFVVTNYERPGKIHIGPGQDMQLYCVQTKAIQSYHVNSDQCYTPTSNVNTPRDRQPEITQISIKNDIASPLPQLTEEPVNLLAKLQLLANPQNSESAIHLTKIEQVTPPENEPSNAVPEKTSMQPTLEPNVDAAITSTEEETSEEQESQTSPSDNKKEEVAPANENTSFAESDESKAQTIGSPSTIANKTKSRTRKRKPETKEEIPPETVPANNQSSQAKNKNDSGKKITILSRPKQDGAISPPPTAAVEQPPSSTTLAPTPETSGNNAASLSNQQLLAAFSALQKRISASTENTMQTQMEKLYNRLETERKEREKQERERQEKLLAAVSQTVNQNLANHLETIFKKEIQATVMPTLLKSVSQSMETTVLKLLQDNFKKLVVHVILPKLDAAIKDTLGKHNVQDTVASEINKQIELSINQSLERNMQHLLEVAISQSLDQPVRESFLNCFQGLLIPSFERSCQAMFLQLNDAFQSGLADRVQKQAYSTDIGNDAALTEQLKLAVSTLVETSTVMSKTIVDTQNKILNDYVERRNTNLLQSTAENNNNSAPRVSDPSLLISKDLQSLIAQRKYEQAFATALSARNIETLTWLISQLNPQEIFSQTPLPLSQYVLLSLVQQLGFDLSKDTRLKLNWLRESALVLNLKDSVISEHAPIILSKLLRNLEQHYPAFAETPNASSFKLLMHVINSLIK